MDNQIKQISAWLGAGSINVFGRPFAGKDTQGAKLADSFGGALIGGGDILRSHPEPERIKEILSAGGLIPHDFYLGMLVPYLSQPKFSGKPLILSSVGRSHGEEATILKAASGSGHPLRAVVLLALSEDEVWRRFEASKVLGDRGGRSDDDREVLKNRLAKFEAKTEPVIAFYREKGLLIEVDGTKSREEVTAEILDALFERSQRVA